MSMSEILSLIEDRTYRLDGTDIPSKRFEMIVTILELYKLAVKMGQPALPIEIEVEGVKKHIRNKQELIKYLNKLEAWLLEAREKLGDDDLAPILSRAKIIILQLVYTGIFERGEFARVDYAQHINKIKEKRHSLSTLHHQGEEK